jgi:hypothetical protein
MASRKEEGNLLSLEDFLAVVAGLYPVDKADETGEADEADEVDEAVVTSTGDVSLIAEKKKHELRILGGYMCIVTTEAYHLPYGNAVFDVDNTYTLNIGSIPVVLGKLVSIESLASMKTLKYDVSSYINATFETSNKEVLEVKMSTGTSKEDIFYLKFDNGDEYYFKLTKPGKKCGILFNHPGLLYSL